MTLGPAPDFDDDFRRQLAELLSWRRDVRRFKPDPLAPGQLDRLLDLACLAPSVGLSQPWRFVSVESAEARAGVIAAFEAANAEALGDYGGERASLYARLKLAGLREAPVHLAVFCDEATGQGHGLGRRTMPEMLAYSTVTAVHTLWLAARAEGIGVGWVSIFEPEAVAGLLAVPPDWRLVAYLCIGHPLEDQAEPELARAGWQQREPISREVLTR